MQQASTYARPQNNVHTTTQPPPQAEPINVFEYPSTPPEYLRVTAAGVYDAAHTHYIGPRPRSVVGGSQVGYVVITPLVDAATGRAVLVNRGWVPTAWRGTEGQQEAAASQRVSTGWGLRTQPQQQQQVLVVIVVTVMIVGVYILS